MCVLLGRVDTEQMPGDRRNFTFMRHAFIVVTCNSGKTIKIAVYVYGNHLKIKTGVTFLTTLYRGAVHWLIIH